MSDFLQPQTRHEFSRPEYWSREPFLSPGDLPNPGIQPRSPTLQADSLPAEPQGKPNNTGVGSLSPSRSSCIAGGFLTNWARTFCLFLTTASTLNSSDFQLTAILFSTMQWSIIVQQSNQNSGSFEGIVLDVNVRYLFWHQEGSSKLLLYLVLSCKLSSLEFSFISSLNLQISLLPFTTTATVLRDSAYILAWTFHALLKMKPVPLGRDKTTDLWLDSPPSPGKILWARALELGVGKMACFSLRNNPF